MGFGSQRQFCDSCKQVPMSWAGGGAHINCWGWKSLLFGLVLSAVMVCGGKVVANVLLTMTDASLAGPRGSAMMLAALGGETPKTFRV